MLRIYYENKTRMGYLDCKTKKGIHIFIKKIFFYENKRIKGNIQVSKCIGKYHENNKPTEYIYTVGQNYLHRTNVLVIEKQKYLQPFK